MLGVPILNNDSGTGTDDSGDGGVITTNSIAGVLRDAVVHCCDC